MSLGLSPNPGVTVTKVSSVSGLSILTTLISPLMAVCLSQYLHTHEKRQTTFALPVQNIDARLVETRYAEPHPIPSLAEESPKDHVESRQTFAVQSEKQARARKLIERANGAKADLASQSVMLRRAKDIATQAGDGETAFQAIDAMAESSPIDANAMKLAVLAKLASVAKTPAQHASIAAQALTLMDQAVSQDHFMVAAQLGKLALAEAKRAADKELLAHVQRQMAEMAERVRAKEIAVSR